MKTFKINYLAPNSPANQRAGKPVMIHKVATYHAETEKQAIEKFERLHGGKYHLFQFIWEETEIDRLQNYLTKKLMR